MHTDTSSIFASIIIPIYNAEKWLEECIHSVLAQSDPDFELLLIDDGSKDCSSSICEKYQKKDTRIRWIRQPNQGVSSARNAGLNRANGEFLLFMDADDIMHPRMIEILKQADHEFHSDCYFWDYQEFKQELLLAESPNAACTICQTDDLLIQVVSSKGKVLGYVWNKAFRRSCVENIRFDIDIRLQEDVLFVCRCLASGRIKQCCKLDMVLYGYRQHAQSATHRHFTSNQLTVLLAQDRIIHVLANGSSAAKHEAERLSGKMPRHICIMNKKSMFSRIEKRKDALRIIDSFWNSYRRFADPQRWPFKEKCYFLLQIICYRFRS